MGDYGAVSPLVSLSLAIFGIAVVITLVFSIVGLASDSKKLKKALISVGLFAAVVVLGYALYQPAPANTLVYAWLPVFFLFSRIVDLTQQRPAP